MWVHISSSHRDTKILDENVNSFLDAFTNLPKRSSRYLGIYVRDTKILVLEEELETIELIVGIIPVVRILSAQLTVVLFIFVVQIVHLLTLILIDLL